MIYVGIDDTDTLDSPGTNQLARVLVSHVVDRYRCLQITRHQLLVDPRVPYTSKNGSASIVLLPEEGGLDKDLRIPKGFAVRTRHSVQPTSTTHCRYEARKGLIDELRAVMRDWFIDGSDPGFCVTATVPAEVTEFGRRCQRELVSRQEARELAAKWGLHLEGLGGTQDGVVGALAAVGLMAGGNDGRIVQIGTWPDDLSGPQEVEVLLRRGVEIRCLQTGQRVSAGPVDVGKHLRPNYRSDRIVLYVRPTIVEGRNVTGWQAVRFT